ncbi:MAG: NUDIX domain-containing protein [Ignavibacteriaceae bacterium]
MENDILINLAQANAKRSIPSEPNGKNFIITKETTLKEIFEKAYNSQDLDGITTFEDLIHFLLHIYKSIKYVGVGVGGILVHDQHVLLYKREKDPEKGYWSMPGGSVRLNEKIETAISREFSNITGFDIDIKSLKLLCVTNHIHHKNNKSVSGEEKYHYLSPAFLITPTEDIRQKYNSIREKSFLHNYEDEKEKLTGSGKYHLKWFPLAENTDHQNSSNRNNLTLPTIRALESYNNYLIFQRDTEKMLKDQLKKILGGNFG